MPGFRKKQSDWFKLDRVKMQIRGKDGEEKQVPIGRGIKSFPRTLADGSRWLQPPACIKRIFFFRSSNSGNISFNLFMTRKVDPPAPANTIKKCSMKNESQCTRRKYRSRRIIDWLIVLHWGRSQSIDWLIVRVLTDCQLIDWLIDWSIFNGILVPILHPGTGDSSGTTK